MIRLGLIAREMAQPAAAIEWLELANTFSTTGNDAGPRESPSRTPCPHRAPLEYPLEHTLGTTGNDAGLHAARRSHAGRRDTCGGARL